MKLRQILRPDGTLTPGAEMPVTDDELIDLYRAMVKLRVIDDRMVTLQRQGRIGFYGMATGHEASVVGSCSVLAKGDWIFPGLREGAMTWMRGLPMQEFVDQLFGNARDRVRGRQMPCHHTFREGGYVSLSAVIATQLPQAAGAAMAARIRGDDTVVVGYFGDGASSATDFHAAANFAGVFRAPLVLYCQNNQWAISVPLERQTASESIAIKSVAYGIPGVRVDGNDILGVIEVTREAVDRARSGQGPTLVEAVTYRVGPHTTSDDPSVYRDESITEEWKTQRDPIERVRRFLTCRELWTEAQEAEWCASVEAELAHCIREAEAAPAPPLESIFEDVYSEMPQHLREEESRLRRLLGGPPP